MTGNPTESESQAGSAKRRFFSGDSLQQALVQAANHFHIAPEEIAYQALDKRHGFLKARHKVMIEVDPNAPRRATPAPRAQPVPPLRPSAAAQAPKDAPSEAPAEAPAVPESARPESRPPAPPERRSAPIAPPSVLRAGAEGLVTLPERPRGASERYPLAEGPAADAAAKSIELLVRLSGLELTARILQGEDRLEIDLAGGDIDWCFADDGELLLSFEHLLPRMIRTMSGQSVLCRVDCDNFHEIREERLRSLAQHAADEVRLKGRPRTLPPMNPADRRIVHMTLADDPAVATESEGDGYFKRVTVRPV
jgi:spoIIIJ-associated protein